MNAWMACHPVSRCKIVFKHMPKLHQEPIRLTYNNSKYTNNTYVKAGPKRMAAVIFRDTATNCFH